MPFEDDLGLALREAVEASSPPPLELLAIGAARRGLRRKRRRAVIASAASVAVLAGAGVVALQLRSSGGSMSTQVAAGRPTAAAVTTATPSAAGAAPSTSPSRAAVPPVPSSQVLELLRGKLPPGLQLSHPTTRDLTSPLPGVLAGFTIADGDGKGTVSVEITRGVPRSSVGPSCGGLDDCTDTALPDGSNLMVSGGGPVRGATLFRRDGITLWLESGNVPGPGSGDTKPYPNDPLLSGAQLSALAQDPVWLPVMASIPAAS